MDVVEGFNRSFLINTPNANLVDHFRLEVMFPKQNMTLPDTDWELKQGELLSKNVYFSELYGRQLASENIKNFKTVLPAFHQHTKNLITKSIPVKIKIKKNYNLLITRNKF